MKTLLLLFCFSLSSLWGSETVYEEISRSWQVLPHRVPGTPEYYRAADALENALKRAGIKPVRQYFQTPVQEMTHLRFAVNGRTVPIFALMPNNAGLISTGDTPVNAEAVYLPAGATLPRVQIANRIVLIDWGRNELTGTLFSEGAKAVIFVGDPQADQWSCAKGLTSFQSAFPCFYMERETARKNDLLSGKAVPAVLEAQSRWKNVQGVNIWAHIPAGEKKMFALNRPEALLLGARLDTYGMVPGLCRGDRERENAALLADCAAQLAAMKLPRSVFILFYGGSFNAFDGIRHFLFPFAEADRKAFPTIRDYRTGQQEELQRTEKFLKELPSFRPGEKSNSQTVFGIFHWTLAGGFLFLYLLIVFLGYFKEYPFAAPLWQWGRTHWKKACGIAVLLLTVITALPFGAEKLFPGDTEKRQAQSELNHELKSLIMSEVVRTYNNCNYELSALNRRLRSVSGSDKDLLLRKKELLGNRRTAVADLRRGINENSFKESMRPLLEEIKALAAQRLTRRCKELKEESFVLKGWEEIAAAAASHTITGSFFFDFSSVSQPFTLAVRGNESMHSFHVFDSAFYTKNFAVLKKIAAATPALQKSASPLLLTTLEGGLIPVNMSTASLGCLPSSAGIVFSIPGWTMRNIPGEYAFDEIPGIRHFRLQKLAGPLKAFFANTARSPEMSINSLLPASPRLDKYLNYCFKNGKYHGRQYYLLAQDGKEMESPAAGAIVHLNNSEYLRSLPVSGFSRAALGLVNSAGYVRMPGVTVGGISTWQVKNLRPVNSGALLYSESGCPIAVSLPGTSANFKLFRCSGGAIPAYSAPLTTDYVGFLSTNNALTGNPFRQSRSFASAGSNEAYLYTDQKLPASVYVKNETFLLNLQEKQSTPAGIMPTPEQLRNLNVQRQGLKDTLLLNKARLDVLHKRNIFNAAVEKHNEKAAEYREQAEKARSRNEHSLARSLEIFGQTLAVRAYRPLRQTVSDMIHSVLILLILTVPFAFALERLLVCSTNIYRQLGGVLLFALATFGILYFTHPAFMLSQTPMVIFIAFFIILMSLSVIRIVMERFKNEVQAMQSLNTSAHRTNRSDGTFWAALLVGVSGMRNRPVKTFLTVMTVVLLTYTIISFASFDNTGAVRKVYFGDSSSEDRIELFLGNHMGHDTGMMKAVKELYGKDYHVFFRTSNAITPAQKVDTWPLQINFLYNPVNQRFSKLDAVAGFEPGEKFHNALLKKLLPELKAHEKGEVPTVFIADTLAAQLGLKKGDKAFLRSIEVRVGGLFSPAALDNFTFLDNGKVTGPNFLETSSLGGPREANPDSGQSDSSHFVWNAPDMTLLTDSQTAYKLNGGIHAAILYPRKDRHINMDSDAVNLCEAFYGMVYVGGADGVFKYFFAESSSSSGLSEIAVPLLLGALIIFSSLLGSIADREKEIFTFSALGLSPFEVGSLFFAESAVYAVVGALGGYLLSQISMSVLTLLARFGVVQAPEMNYSSMSTVYTLLTVMAVVLLSTIYPAIKASRSATPDVARQWKMPPMQGDRLTFNFPFTVSAADFGGILVFIGEFFRNHEDSTLGNFACSAQKVTNDRLEAKIALAPFDLGVAETFVMYSSPSEIGGIDVVTVEITREGGSDRNFMRANRRFVDEMRNQFLLWRTLDAERTAHYRSLADKKRSNENV